MPGRIATVWQFFIRGGLPQLPKFAIFKTMGYPPGFFFKIGRFGTLRNSPQIFTNNPESSWKSICTHIWDVSGSLERCPALTQIRHLQNHGCSPGFLLKIGRFRALPNSPQIFTNSPESSWKSICEHIRRFREFGTIPGTYPNPPSSKPWASPGFLLKIGRFRALPN